MKLSAVKILSLLVAAGVGAGAAPVDSSSATEGVQDAGPLVLSGAPVENMPVAAVSTAGSAFARSAEDMAAAPEEVSVAPSAEDMPVALSVAPASPPDETELAPACSSSENEEYYDEGEGEMPSTSGLMAVAFTPRQYCFTHFGPPRKRLCHCQCWRDNTPQHKILFCKWRCKLMYC